MIKMVIELQRWFKNHNLDPDRVRLVMQTYEPRFAYEIARQLASEFDLPEEIRDFNLHGMNISIRWDQEGYDESRRWKQK